MRRTRHECDFSWQGQYLVVLDFLCRRSMLKSEGIAGAQYVPQTALPRLCPVSAMNCYIFGTLLVREGFSQQAQFGAHLVSQVLKSQAGSFVRYCVFVVLYDLRGRRTALAMFSIV